MRRLLLTPAGVARYIGLSYYAREGYRIAVAVSLRQKISRNVLSLSLLIVGVALLGDPILGFSQLLPDGMFSLILGIVLLAGGVFLYWSETGTDG